MAKDKKNDFKNLSYDEMVAKRNELKKSYMDLRFQAVMSHVENPMQKRTMRRDIARLNTLIHQQDLAKFRAAAAEAIAAKN
ncbi:MAG: 50S ribosomal protein L29 [Treponema sp.]|jgi:large subunit ribosomal protein L29|nr:50S ribosomal protein L29 [Treponema sp.]